MKLLNHMNANRKVWIPVLIVVGVVVYSTVFIQVMNLF